MKARTFEADIRSGKGGGAYVDIPFDVEEAYGTRGRVPVTATFDGVSYRGSIAPMGKGRHVLGVTKAIRARIGREVGDRITVSIQRDSAPREVSVPEDLAAALARRTKVRDAFAALSYTRRREFVQWVEGAKRAETRARRIARTVEMVRDGESL